MWPHPILMQVLCDDRSREVEAELTKRSLRAHRDEAADNDLASTRHHSGLRPLAFLALVLGLRKSNAAGAPI